MPERPETTLANLERDAKKIVADARRELEQLKDQNAIARQPLQPVSNEPKVQVFETVMNPLQAGGGQSSSPAQSTPAQPAGGAPFILRIVVAGVAADLSIPGATLV